MPLNLTTALKVIAKKLATIERLRKKLRAAENKAERYRRNYEAAKQQLGLHLHRENRLNVRIAEMEREHARRTGAPANICADNDSPYRPADEAFKTYRITRSGVYDHNDKRPYWADWMCAHIGARVYRFRSHGDPERALFMDAETYELYGNATRIHEQTLLYRPFHKAAIEAARRATINPKTWRN